LNNKEASLRSVVPNQSKRRGSLPVDLNTFIVVVFGLTDERIEDRALGARGPLPRLSDAEVLTIEIVGEFVGLDTDEAIFRFFRRYYGEWFPASAITRFSVAPADAPKLSVLQEIAEFTSGLLLGDRSYHSPKRRKELAGMGVELSAPDSSKKRDPAPKKSAFLIRLRYRIVTVFSQLTRSATPWRGCGRVR
jgi:hypothetical protein